MNRRRAIAIASAVTVTTAGSVLAVAANVGLMGFARSEPSALGALRAEDPIELVVEEQASTAPPSTTTSAQALPPEVVVQYEDIYVQDPAPVPAGTIVVTAPPSIDSAPAPTVTGEPDRASTVGTDDDEYDDGEYDDEYEDDEHEDDEYEDGEYDDEYEDVEEHDGDEDDD